MKTKTMQTQPITDRAAFAHAIEELCEQAKSDGASIYDVQNELFAQANRVAREGWD